jgi:glycine betaine/proline transport system substrate-binding protein
MTFRRQWAIVALVAVTAMLAAACSNVGGGGGASSSVSAGVNPANANITIKIAVNDWVGAAANAGVAKDLLEKLGYKVDLVKIDEFAQFPALARGQLDATLEVWPSGHGADYKKYIQGNAGVVDGGMLGVTGLIGWYLPTYMLQQHPELATWEGLKKDASLFATAETGSQGQLLDGDPSYVTFDGEIIKSLGLNFKVVYAGSEAAELTALKQAYAKQAPILMYFWTPHWAQSVYKLTEVELPTVTPACSDAADNNGGKGYACAYPTDHLYKAFNADLQTRAPQASALLKAINYTNEDQNGIALDISAGMSPEAAAQKWLDANPTKWQPWIDAANAAG